jgi:hypothetical protein
MREGRTLPLPAQGVAAKLPFLQPGALPREFRRTPTTPIQHPSFLVFFAAGRRWPHRSRGAAPPSYHSSRATTQRRTRPCSRCGNPARLHQPPTLPRSVAAHSRLRRTPWLEHEPAVSCTAPFVRQTCARRGSESARWNVAGRGHACEAARACGLRARARACVFVCVVASGARLRAGAYRTERVPGKAAALRGVCCCGER